MDFGALGDLSKSIRDGFVFDWKYSRYRQRHHGSSSRERPGERIRRVHSESRSDCHTSRGQTRLTNLVSAGERKTGGSAHAVLSFLALLFMGGNTGRLRRFSTSPALKTVAWPIGARGRKKGTGVALLRERFRRPAGTDHVRTMQAGLVKDCDFTHAEMLRLYRDLISLRKQWAQSGKLPQRPHRDPI